MQLKSAAIDALFLAPCNGVSALFAPSSDHDGEAGGGKGLIVGGVSKHCDE